MKRTTWATPLLACCLIWLAANAAPAGAQAVDPDFWIPDGQIYDSAYVDNVLYVAGKFTMIGPPTGCGVPIDKASGLALSGFPKVVGEIWAVESDGSGGWYIGGEFSAVGGWPRQNIAHIRADLSVGPLDLAAGRTVEALALDGNILYAGGSFGTFDGQTRENLAAIDLSTGQLTSWNPSTNDYVMCLAIGSGVVYAGGWFTTANGSTRNRAAAFSKTTGGLTSWNPNASSPSWSCYVSELTLDGSRVYVGGYFDRIGGQNRNAIAALNTTSGSAYSWNPSANYEPYDIKVHNGLVYACGAFSWIGGQYRDGIAALSASTGQATAWDVQLGGNPPATSGLIFDGNTVYFAGNFDSVQGQSRYNLAAVDIGTAEVRPWDPRGTDYILGFVEGTNGIYAGGRFVTMGGEPRENLAAINVSTGRLLPWNPGANDYVRAIVVDGVNVYVGGDFSYVGGQVRPFAASLNIWTGDARAWNPQISTPATYGGVYTLEVSEDDVYLGGYFSQAGGQLRNNLAAVTKAGALATDWNPDPNSSVTSIRHGGGTVYIGGSFTTVGGQTHERIAAIDAATGQPRFWPHGADSGVSAIELRGGVVYVGGSFTTIGGQPRNRIAALHAANGTATDWNPDAEGPVYDLAVSGGAIYAVGSFDAIGGQPRQYLASLDVDTGLARDWAPVVGRSPQGLTVGDGRVFVDGNFDSAGDIHPTAYLAVFTADDVPPAWPIEWDRHISVHVEESVASMATQVVFRRLLDLPLPDPGFVVPLVDGFATLGGNSLDQYFAHYADIVEQIDLQDFEGQLLGHIKFHYDQDDYDAFRGVDAFVFLHNDEARMTAANTREWPYKEKGWEYYEEGEYPVSMLIPPTRESFGLGDATKEPVIFLHGVNAGYDQCFDDLPELIDQDTYDGWQFAYPHDQFIDENARLLGLAVERVLNGGIPGHYGYTTDRVALVAHSMGGLVSRAYIQGGDYFQRGLVSKLLMFGTPNHGSYSSYRAYHDHDLLSLVADGFGKLDPYAPAHEMMTPGSLYLTVLNAFTPRGLGTGDLARDYLVVAGTQDYLPELLAHREVFRQDDGFVAASSASLLEHEVPLGLVFRNHLNMKKQEDGYDAKGIIETFLDRDYDPVAGTPDFPDDVYCFRDGFENDVCTERFATDYELGILEFNILNAEPKVKRYLIELPENEPGVMNLTANAGEKLGDGNRYLQRIAGGDEFFSITQRTVLQKEIAFWGPEGAYDVRVHHDGAHVASFQNTTNFQWLSTTSAAIVLNPLSGMAIAAPNQLLLTHDKAAAVGYSYPVDATVDTLIFNLSSAVSPADFSQHGFQLVEPGGRVIDAAVAAADPNLDFYEDTSYGPVQCMIVDPVDGLWQIQHDDSVPAPEVRAYLYAGYRAHLDVADDAWAAGDSLRFTVAVSGSENCTSETVAMTATVTPPGTTVSVDVGAVALTDLGGGLYEGLIESVENGRYRLTLNASCQDATLGSLARTAVQDVWVDRSASDVSGVRDWNPFGDVPDDDILAVPPLTVLAVAPNPFNPRTTLAFELGRGLPVDIGVYDVSGRLVRRLVSEHRAAGVHRVVWDGKDGRGQGAAAGVYFVRVEVPGNVVVRKVALIK